MMLITKKSILVGSCIESQNRSICLFKLVSIDYYNREITMYQDAILLRVSSLALSTMTNAFAGNSVFDANFDNMRLVSYTTDNFS